MLREPRTDPEARAEAPRRRGLLRAIERARPGADLEALRDVLVGPEQVRLEAVEGATSATSLARVLPEATVRADDMRGDDMATALAKPMRRALRDVARREPALFAEILAPTIGQAVRKAVKEVVAAVLQRMNQLMDRALSVESIRWRFEARRTHKTLAEVVLAHTVLYRVEWVALLHTTTSLVLEQANLEEVAARAPDQLAAMLQAIGSFVSDAFHDRGKLETLEVGDLTIWLERDPAFTLATAIRGPAPLELREQFRRTLSDVRTLHSEDIAPPVVDTSQFADTHPLLAECLVEKRKATPRRAQRLLALAAIAALVVIGGAVARSLAASRVRQAVAREDAALRAAYKQTFEATPGIVVTSISRGVGGLYRIEGLRDPRAEEPLQRVALAGLPPPVFALAPYESLDPRLGAAFTTPGAAMRELEQIEFTFPNAGAVVDTNDPEIARAARLVRTAEGAAARAGASLCVEVLGDATAPGPSPLNSRLRASRAASVIEALVAAGVPRDLLALRTDDPRQPAEHRRRVSFRGVLRPDPRLPGCAA